MDVNILSAIQVVKGEMNDLAALSTAVAQSCVVVSLLGPNIIDNSISPTQFADYYKSSVFPLMRQHGVRRILAMGTLSIVRPQDRSSLFRFFVVQFVRLVANTVYHNILNLARTFDEEAHDLDWTVFRIARIPGESDETNWRRDREDGETFVGWIGEKGWSGTQRRGALARWLADEVETATTVWIGKMPAVSRLVGSGRRVS